MSPQPKLILSETTAPVRLGRYDLGRELGRGFSSIVYEATDTLRGRRVAVKVLTFLQNLSPASRQEMAERFEREARAISALSHPAIVGIYEVGLAGDGRQYIAMEYLEGETLRARIDRTGPLLRSEAVPLMVQIADALQYAHGRGIIHRDVKPDNIFLCPDGTARLMDFGIAHVFTDNGLTQTGMLIGSPAYMSPEQINGEVLDGRSDVFSLAATLAEALTAHKPFDGPNIPAVMNRILNQPPQLAGIGSVPMRKALERALAKNLPSRTPSAGAFAESLRRAVPFPGSLETTTGTQVMARPVLPARKTSVFHFPERAAWAAAGLALAALIGLLLFTHHLPAPASSRVVVISAPSAPLSRVYQISSQWHRARVRYDKRKVFTRPRMHTASLPDVQITQDASTPAPPAPSYVSPEPSQAQSPPISLPMPQPEQNTQLASPPYAMYHPPTVKVAASRQERHERTESLSPARPAAPLSVENTPSLPVPAVSAPATPEMAYPPTAPPSDQSSVGINSPPRLVLRTAAIVPPDAPFSPAFVRLLVSVNDEGDVSDARVVQSSGSSSLDAAAIATVMSWEFEPAFHNGRATTAHVVETVRFH